MSTTESERKVLVRLKGGIGNQLFQYAFALQLARGNPEQVTCLLDYFKLEARHGGFALPQLLGPEVLSTETPPAGNGWVYVNGETVADSDLSILRDSPVDIFIDGYFQNVANYLPVISKLKLMFRAQFNQSLYEQKLRSLLGKPQEEPIVALHLRRGDFLNPDVRSAHGIPAPESMLGCLERLGTPGYSAVVFSDSAVAIELPCHAIRLIGPQPRTLAGDVDELRLMSCCNWIIASNSTFSYWAGILSDSVRQLFIPDPWMRSGSVRTASLLAGRIQAYSAELL